MLAKKDGIALPNIINNTLIKIRLTELPALSVIFWLIISRFLKIIFPKKSKMLDIKIPITPEDAPVIRTYDKNIIATSFLLAPILLNIPISFVLLLTDI